MNSLIKTNISIVALTNGLTIKGSYKHAANGLFVDIYIMSDEGFVLDTKTFAYAGREFDAQARMTTAMSKVLDALVLYKIDQLTSAKVLQVVVPAVMEKVFGKARMSKAA